MQIPLKFNFWLLVFSAALGLVFSFKPSEFQKNQKLKIELGQTYRNDRVKIFLDKKLVYNKQVITPDSALISDAFTVNKPKKPFSITLEINGAKFEKSAPKQTKELDKEDYSILIDYDREAEEIDIKRKIIIILYD